MIWFVNKPHNVQHGVTMVEIWRDTRGEGEFVAAIYPEADGIRIVSAYEGMVRGKVEVTRWQDVEKKLRVINIEIGRERLTKHE